MTTGLVTKVKRIESAGTKDYRSNAVHMRRLIGPPLDEPMTEVKRNGPCPMPILQVL
ncbi:hypothetical protein [Peribacillus muralis]|uniref:hypothetical protein n=1 Tax=Peribacillus muralis TaxID=264697 RepID=UPI003CFBFC40